MDSNKLENIVVGGYYYAGSSSAGRAAYPLERSLVRSQPTC